MKRVNIAALKDELSKHVRAVERGASLIVTDRNRPVAQLVPIEDEDAIDVTPPSSAFSAVRGKRYSPTPLAIDSLALLLEERGKR